MDVVVASENPGKIREMRLLLDIPKLSLVTRDHFSDWPELEESGSTFRENALIKACEVRDHFDMPALADDSGLAVDHLGGRPGVHSSRYGGPQGDSDLNINKLLEELEGVPGDNRTARYVCVIALALPGGEVRTTRSECEGRILTGRRGTGGFGYDPVFLPSGYDRTMAELSLEEKNAISHRGKALRQIRDVIAGLT
jgi:XTP/dITP diphosphohydrolase